MAQDGRREVYRLHCFAAGCAISRDTDLAIACRDARDTGPLGQADARIFLERHFQGDWGDVDEGDWKLNDQALVDGNRLFSVYRTLRGTTLYVITEATDDQGQRMVTTIVLPEEY